MAAERGCTGIIGEFESDVNCTETELEPMPKIIHVNVSENLPEEIFIEDAIVEPIVNVEISNEELIIGRSPLWSRRRPQLSPPIERNEAVSALCDSFREVNKRKQDNENLKRLLLQDELEFKRKLYELQLQTAQKDVEIKNAILSQINGGGSALHKLLGVPRKKTE